MQVTHTVHVYIENYRTTITKCAHMHTLYTCTWNISPLPQTRPLYKCIHTEHYTLLHAHTHACRHTHKHTLYKCIYDTISQCPIHPTHLNECTAVPIYRNVVTTHTCTHTQTCTYLCMCVCTYICMRIGTTKIFVLREPILYWMPLVVLSQCLHVCMPIEHS